eukprot:737471-Pyramimonas_sp.AAC.1
MQVFGFWRRPFNSEHQHVEATFKRTVVEYPEEDPATWGDQQELHEGTLNDLKQLRYAIIQTLPSWRAWPNWSAPGDILRVLFDPKW